MTWTAFDTIEGGHVRRGVSTARRWQVAVLCALLGVALASAAALGGAGGSGSHPTIESKLERSAGRGNPHEAVQPAFPASARGMVRAVRSRPTGPGSDLWFAAAAGLLASGLWVGTNRRGPSWSWRCWWTGNARWRGPPELRVT